MSQVIDKALVNFNRVARLKVTVADSFNQLAKLTNIISDAKANIKRVSVERAFANASIGYTEYLFTVEIRGTDHLDEILSIMSHAGYEQVAIEGR